MRLSFACLRFNATALALAAALCGATAAAADAPDHEDRALPLAGTPNPDAGHIAVREDRVEVMATGSLAIAGAHPLLAFSPWREDLQDLARGTGLATADVRNVQWAVQNVRRGGTVQLRPGARGEAFQFGSAGIYLPGIRLVGAGRAPNGAPLTVIAGGLLAVRLDFLSRGDRASVEGLWFDGTDAGAIYTGMADYERLEISGNRISNIAVDDFLLHPPNGVFYAGRLHLGIHANGKAAVAPFTGAHAPRCRIREIVVSGNVDDQLSATESPAGSELEFAFCDYDSLIIADNFIRSAAMPLEVFQNTNPESSLSVTGNTFIGGTPAVSGGAALFVVDNEGARVKIDGNQLEASGPGGGIGMVLSHHTPGATFVVRRNQLTLDDAVIALDLGFQNNLPSASTSLSGAVFADNVIAGSAFLGVFAWDAPATPTAAAFVNTSSQNVFFGNDFSGLAVPPWGFHTLLGAGTHDNLFQGNPGLVLDVNLGTNNVSR